MKSILILTVTMAVITAEDTFSIVAVDPESQEIGSAGASCIGGSIIISDVHPGVGGIHTQAYWLPGNQDNAHDLMVDGLSPEQIIVWLEAHDVQNNPTIRQYGVVDLVDGGRSAAYTGENCSDYKGHLTGQTYAIQGNILLGEEIINDMETNFLNTKGFLGDRLMEALQGAKVPGADTRCLDDGISTLSAFIRLAKPDNSEDSLFLHLNVNFLNSFDPIDSLQTLYNNWISENFSPGDVNHDSFVDILDLVLTINIILENYNTPISQFNSADIDETGTIDIVDLIIISAIIMN